jgi:lipopolysaccharide export system permease protein
MKLIDRYVGWQVLTTALFAVAILSVVLVLGNVFKQLLELLVNANAPLDLILSFIAYILPFSLTFTIPWGFLTAVLLVFGKMSAENELIALRTSGVSIPRICLPVFFLAILSVGICLWINVDVAPKAQVKMKDALYNIATNNPLAMFGSDKVIDDFPGQKIYVESSSGAKLSNLHVYELNKDSDAMQVVFAQRGRIETDRANKQILLHIYDGRLEQRNEDSPNEFIKINRATMQESTFAISLVELYEKNKKRKGMSGMTAGELLDRLNSDAREATTAKDAKTLAADRSSTRTEINKRFSFSLASFAFALIGVPLAITAHRKETSIGFLLSLVVAFVYFLFIIIADTVKEKPELHPEWLIWAPNVLFIGLGLWLFFRLSRR